MRVLVLPAKISSSVSHYNKILRTSSTTTIRFSTEYLLVCSYCLNPDTPVNKYLSHARIFCPQYGTVIIRHITDETDVPEYLHYSLQDLVSAGYNYYSWVQGKLHELTGVIGAENQKKHDVLHLLTLLFTSVINLQRTCKDILKGTDRSKGLVVTTLAMVLLRPNVLSTSYRVIILSESLDSKRTHKKLLPLKSSLKRRVNM
uniref:Uncharacterized protein n=1 Tax=Rhizophagus irregularis (strain DAOM 181602 / DAOM 197198 / MUCL 43194) TaxID=747089 RepID=U9STA7_RHIID